MCCRVELFFNLKSSDDLVLDPLFFYEFLDLTPLLRVSVGRNEDHL